MRALFSSRPPAATSRSTAIPASPNASTIRRAPNAVASISARYISSGREDSVKPTKHARELVVDEDRAVAAPPIQRNEAVLANRLLGEQRRQVLVDAEAGSLRLLVIVRRNRVLDEPREDIADAL